MGGGWGISGEKANGIVTRKKKPKRDTMAWEQGQQGEQGLERGEGMLFLSKESAHAHEAVKNATMESCF
jgi:hypothetical protein